MKSISLLVALLVLALMSSCDAAARRKRGASAGKGPEMSSLFFHNNWLTDLFKKDETEPSNQTSPAENDTWSPGPVQGDGIEDTEIQRGERNAPFVQNIGQSPIDHFVPNNGPPQQSLHQSPQQPPQHPQQFRPNFYPPPPPPPEWIYPTYNRGPNFYTNRFGLDLPRLPIPPAIFPQRQFFNPYGPPTGAGPHQFFEDETENQSSNIPNRPSSQPEG